MSLLPYNEQITANNEVENTTTTFIDVLQKDFEIFEPGTYKVGYVYLWRQEKKDQAHRIRVRVDGVVNDDLTARQYMGGKDDETDIRELAGMWTLVDFTVGTFDVDLQLASEQESSFIYYRRLYIERWD